MKIAVSSFLQWLEPKDILGTDSDEMRRGRVLVICCLTAVLFITPFSVVRAVWDGADSPTSYVIGLLSIGLLTSLLVYRGTASVVTSGLYLMLVACAGLVVYVFIDGGFRSSAIVWYPIMPLFTVFFSGFRAGQVVAGFLIVDLVLMYFAHAYDLVPITMTSESQLNLLFLGSTTAVIVILMVVARSYAQWQITSREELAEANRVKSEFLSNMSHELRTPLNAIIGFAQLLRLNHEGESSQAKQIQLIQESGEQLLVLVNELLDISKIESGTLMLNLSEVDIDKTITQVIDMHAYVTEMKNIDIEFQASGNRTSVTADSSKMKQILINLLSNAIKVSPPDSTIGIFVDQTDSLTRISVSDDGPGVPEDQIEKIFDHFHSFDAKPLQTESSGIGLGLSVSRKLAELHGGELTVSNGTRNYAGATFVLDLPAHEESKR